MLEARRLHLGADAERARRAQRRTGSRGAGSARATLRGALLDAVASCKRVFGRDRPDRAHDGRLLHAQPAEARPRPAARALPRARARLGRGAASGACTRRRRSPTASTSAPSRRSAVELVCPRDRTRARATASASRGTSTRSSTGSRVLLVEEEAPTHAACHGRSSAAAGRASGIDPFVQEVIAATCGRLYEHLIGDLPEYPIPELRLPPGEGRTLPRGRLQLGPLVRRARRGAATRASAIDPSLKAIQAARRVAEQLGVDARVRRRRRAPPAVRGRERSTSSSRTASSSTSRSATRSRRSTRSDACSSRAASRSMQMANVYGAAEPLEPGARAALPRAADALRRPLLGPAASCATSSRSAVGPTELSVDGFFTLNPQPDRPRAAAARATARSCAASEALRRVVGARAAADATSPTASTLARVVGSRLGDVVGAALGLVVASPALAAGGARDQARGPRAGALPAAPRRAATARSSSC